MWEVDPERTKKDAQKWLTATLREIDLGAFVEPVAMSVGAFFDKWLETAARQKVSERTFSDYEWLLKAYVRPRLGAHPLAHIKPLDIQNLYTELQAEGIPARTVRLVHVVLSGAFKQAVRWRLLQHNPVANVELPRHQRQEMRALTEEEAARFLTEASKDHYGMVFAFLLATGARPGECFGLQWKDVDFQRGTVTVRRALYWRKGGGYYFKDPKTARSRRAIPLPASMLRGLAEHRRAQLEELMKAGQNWPCLDLVFTAEGGAPLHIRNLTNRHFKPILKRAKLPTTIRLYDLHHSCATLLMAEGENPKIVSERLGHSTVTLTLDIYSHVSESMQQRATEKLEKLLFGGRHTM